jgi:lysozyme
MRGAKYPDPRLAWPILTDGVRLIAESEWCMLRAYPDPATQGKPYTCGWGETEGVEPNDMWTQEEADQRLLEDLRTRTKAVRAMCTRPPTDHELAALVSLAYNIGLRRDKPTNGGLYWSSVLKLHNAGEYNAAARAFAQYNKARNRKGELVEFDGLTTRRAHEAAMYLTPDAHEDREPMPQVVEPAPTLKTSPTMITSAGLATTGTAIAGASALLEPDTIAKWTEMLQRFGIQPVWALAGLMIAAGLYVGYRRVNQARDGRA